MTDEALEPGLPADGGSPADVAAIAPLTPLTPLALQHLQQTRPWVRFMSVVTFLGAALMAVGAGVMLLVSLLGGFATRGGAPGVVGGAVVGVLTSLLYLVLAAVYVPAGLFLWRYASAIKQLQSAFHPAVLEEALGQQKSFWRFVGILTAIGVAVCIAVFLLAVVGGLIVGFMGARS
jgi:hypothetical protein